MGKPVKKFLLMMMMMIIMITITIIIDVLFFPPPPPLCKECYIQECLAILLWPCTQSSWSPLFSLSIVTVLRIFCGFFFFQSAINTLLSAYLRLFVLLPPTLTPTWCFVFWRTFCSRHWRGLDKKKYWFVHTAVVINSYCSLLFPVQVSDVRCFPSQLCLGKLSNRSECLTLSNALE